MMFICADLLNKDINKKPKNQAKNPTPTSIGINYASNTQIENPFLKQAEILLNGNNLQAVSKNELLGLNTGTLYSLNSSLQTNNSSMEIGVNNQNNFNNHFAVNNPLKAAIEKSIQSNQTVNLTPTLGKTINTNTYNPSVMNNSKNQSPDLNINNNLPIVNQKLPSSKTNGIKPPGYIPSNLNQQVNYPILNTPKKFIPKTNLNSQFSNNTGYVQPGLTKKPSHHFSEPAPTNYGIPQNNYDQNTGEEPNLRSQYNRIKNKVMGNN